MANTLVVSLQKLPAPEVIETLDFETVLAALRADLIERYPALTEVFSLDSEPVNKLLETFAYRELLLRQRVNEAAHAVMLAFSTNSDLEHPSVFYKVSRLLRITTARVSQGKARPVSGLNFLLTQNVLNFSCALPI